LIALFSSTLFVVCDLGFCIGFEEDRLEDDGSDIVFKRRFRGGELERVVDGDSDADTVFDDAGRVGKNDCLRQRRGNC
jgi:hypothetical protein